MRSIKQGLRACRKLKEIRDRIKRLSEEKVVVNNGIPMYNYTLSREPEEILFI